MDTDMVLVGRIGASVGLDGMVRVEVLSDVPQRFAPGSVLYAGETKMQVQYSRPSKKQIAIKFKGIDSRNAAEALRDVQLYIPAEQVVSLPEGTYYHFQLLDMQVVDAQGSYIGEITSILQTGANDVYVVSKDGKETLIPAIAGFILEVDVPNRCMVVDLPAFA